MAVGRGHGYGRLAVLPGLQPGDAGEEVRPRRRVREALGAGAARPRDEARPRAVDGARWRPGRLSGADRRPRPRTPGRPRPLPARHGRHLKDALIAISADQAGADSIPLTWTVAPGSCRAWSATAAATATVTSGSNTLGMM